MAARDAAGVMTYSSGGLAGAGMILYGGSGGGLIESAMVVVGPGTEMIGQSPFSYNANNAATIWLERSGGAWSSTTGHKPMMTLVAGSAEFYTAGAAGLRHITSESTNMPVTSAGSGATTTFIANDRGVYLAHGTTGSTANAVLSSTDGRISRATSSLRYKQDVEDLALTPQQVLQLRPVTWRDRNEVAENPDTTQRYPGWIAEEVHDIDDGAMDVFVVFDQLGRPDALQGDRISAAQQIVLLDHQARITAQAEEIAALKIRLTALEAA